MIQERDLAAAVFAGGGELGYLMRAFDWSQTPLGNVAHWPQSLRLAVGILLASRFPMQILWGPEYIQFYNDAYRPILGAKHPQGLGQRACDCWAEVWDFAGPVMDRVRETGDASWSDDQLLMINRNGYVEECYFTFSYTPVRSESGAVEGIFNAVNETTARVLAERRQHTRGALATRIAKAKTTAEVCAIAAETLASNPADVPFAAIYLVDAGRQQATLAETVRLPLGTLLSLPHYTLTETTGAAFLPLLTVMQTGTAAAISLPDSVADCLPTEPWPAVPTSAIVLPITTPAQEQPVGFFVAGISPHRALDDAYHEFFDAIAGQLGTALISARAYETERKRAEALAEIDRAKTVFFSNVSHEFRTPLTLMLGPLETLLSSSIEALPPSQREQLEMAHRNGLRLLKLVNNLLDFSRIEAGRMQASYEPTDLSVLTGELASVFRSAIEQAGLRLTVDCPPLPEPIYVDHDMWEKIVLNLLSNAFKFTLAGEITVSLQWVDRPDQAAIAAATNASPRSPLPTQVTLQVRDTGTGIPAAELSHLFERFHRVRGAQGRTAEGSGIGLSLVRELVRLHGGTIRVESELGQGTCFTVSLPTGKNHLPSDAISPPRSLTIARVAAPFVEEAERWLPATDTAGRSTPLDLTTDLAAAPLSIPSPTATGALARIFLVDDNADMRRYVTRLLEQQYTLTASSDGRTACIAIQQQLPDLVLTDVMMPGIDGFELLRQLRTNPQTREIPVILLSARAGEEARVEGLAAGADDYLTKPFSARELLARIEATLKLAQLRQAAARREQALRLASDQARQAAEAARSRITSILESITDAFLALDEQWRFTYLNPQAERLLQRQQDLIGKNVWEEFPDAIGSTFDREYHRAVREQITVQFEDFYEPLATWFEVRAYPFEDGLAVYFQDITQRKEAEVERERLLTLEQAARAEAEAANRVKDEFLAVLSHEIRTPLNPILGWARLLQTRQFDAATTARALETIERNAKLQSQLIEDLLDISGILRGKLRLTLTPIDLADTLTAAIETVRLVATGKSIEIKTEIDPTVGVLGDADRLQQVFWNLLSNAVKFTPSAGQITVRLERLGSWAQVSVQDTGKGIRADFLPHVFEYFRQADASTTRTSGGLGLGLAIARHLVEQHNGTIQAASDGEGQGATFTVQLPLLPPVPSGEPVKPRREVAQLEGIHVLVVEDDQDTRALIAFVLSEAGAKTTAVPSAQKALAALTTTLPDIVVSDIGMPDMDGYTLIRQIRALPPEQGGQLPAIALTAYAATADQQQVLAAGFQTHLTKPIEPDDLIHAIARLVGLYRIELKRRHIL